jgi:NADPH:quinone reductase-like Zn-dependent oxidoreductase
MRAWRLHDTSGPEAFRLEQVPDPQPGPGEVRVAVRVAGLNHLDLWVSRGLPAPESLPHTPGADGAGIIDALGEGVAGWSVGDEVIVNPSLSCGRCDYCRRDEMVFCARYRILGEHDPGTLAEKVVLPSESVVAKPLALDWPTAGVFALVTATAYRMLVRARLRPRQTVLVPGIGGGVASAALLLARAQEARVFVTSRSPEKIAWALEQGAEAGFDSTGEFAKELRAITGGGADVVIESIGEATWAQSIRSLNPGGRMVVCGATAGNRVELALPAVWFRQLEIIGSTMFTRSELARVVTMVASGKVKVPVDRIFPFEELPAALAHLDGGAQIGKVGLELG